MVLGVNAALGVELSERLSAGAALTLGNGFAQLGFTGPLASSAMVNTYGLRGTFGLDYELNSSNTIGAFYQTRLDFDFPNAVRFANTYNNLYVSQPETVGLGLANRSLMGGDLLIAADAYYKLWENVPLWEDVYVNQWAFAVGAQLTRGQMKYRIGYSYNTNPLNHSVGDQLDGFPVGQAAVQLFQAASTATINQHRITAGIGRQRFLVPNLDLDLFAGGLLHCPRHIRRLTSVGCRILSRHGTHVAVRRLFAAAAINNNSTAPPCWKSGRADRSHSPTHFYCAAGPAIN